MDEILKESIVDFINKIIEPISVGGIFDSHMIIQQMLKKDSKLFYDFIRVVENADTAQTHGQLAQIIGNKNCHAHKLYEKNEPKSWSENIHGNVSSCTLWVKE